MLANMSAKWTTEQVLMLAPDPASAKNGRGLATLGKWSYLGSQHLESQQAIIWGECQGSGKNPYRTQIDLSEPAFRCSCPSRKFPCKHGLGLFLLLAEQPHELVEKEPPAWVAEWVAARTQRTEKQAQQTRREQVADPAAQEKRAAERQLKVSAGVQELRLWLEDQIRQGLVKVQQEPYQIWDAIAARMVDAQAPGLARHLRELAGIAHTGSGWVDRLLERLGQLYLLIQGFEQISNLPPAVQADLRSQIGWTVNQEEVLSGAANSDLWLTVGQRQEEEDRLRVRRTWLYGLASAKFALLLDFAYRQQPFEQNLLLGACMEAELVFYPSAFPLRALIKTRQESAMLSKNPPGIASVSLAIAAYSQAFATCPWLEQFPMLLQDVVPLQDGESWLLQDAEGAVLPLSAHLEAKKGWQLLALSGGHSLTVFGEWDGVQFMPLSVWVEDSSYGLRN